MEVFLCDRAHEEPAFAVLGGETRGVNFSVVGSDKHKGP